MTPTSVIIGAGIVGLHIAHTLKEKGHDVYVLEKEPFLGEHTSGRNSGVIHSGVFYKTGSFKEKVCIEGNRLTYEWLEKLKVPHLACGKWVVPEEGQENELEAFFERIRQLPIPSPRLMSPEALASEEPQLRKTRGIFVPSTGILDAASYVKALAVYLESLGVSIIMNCQVTQVQDNTLKTTRGDIPFDLAINCAGLFSDEIAKMVGLTDYEIKPCRGDYYLLPKAAVRRPVYHLPYQGDRGTHNLGLGVHLTPTLDGQTLLGPNAFFIEGKEDYKNQSEAASYENAVRYYLPHVQDFTLQVAYSGNRPKLYVKGEALPEFTFVKQKNWIHALGIESPGLTAAPALANHLMSLL